MTSIAKKLNYTYEGNSKLLDLTKVNIKDINMKLNWVYGIRCTDVAKSFCYYCEYV